MLHALFVLLQQNDEKALFLLLLIEETGVPLPAPGDLVILFAGYRASMGQMGVLEACLAVTLAVMMGSTILYTLSRKFGHIVLFKYGKLVHLDEEKLTKVERWIHKHGPVMVLVGRLTPGLRTPTSIMAGVFEVPFLQFLFYATLSAVMWSGFWLGLGYFFGRRLVPLVRHFDKSGYVVFAAVILFIAWLLFRWQRRSRQNARAGVKETNGL